MGGATKGLATKAGSRAIPIAGWALLVIDVLTIGGQIARRADGKSGRLVEAEDAHTAMRDLDEQAAANAAALGYLEADPNILRTIGQEDKINSSIMKAAAQVKQLALERARGADMIARDPHFDSRDSLLDKAFMKADKADLKNKTDRAIRAARASGYGKLKSGR